MFRFRSTPESRGPLRAGRAAGMTRTSQCALVVLAVLVLAPAVGATFDLDAVADRAQGLAREPYREPKGQVPDWLLKISYDQWRDIRFLPEHALWREQHLPFQVQFFHPGLYYNRTVFLNVIDAKGVHPLAFSPSHFDYGHNDFASKVPQNLGYAGFRIHAPIKTANYFDEVIVFLGATYFRAVGKQQVFGLSARGLAVDTALPTGEEFPYFKEFWLMTPTAKAKDLTVYALLDSPSLTGAFRFVIQPGEETTVAVVARIFLRQEVKKIGIAPLTSMFLHGENTTRPFEDFRPEVHDSDGMLLNASHLLYLATKAGAEALGLAEETGDFRAGKAADFVYLRPPEQSPLAAVMRNAPSEERMLAAILTLAGSESVQETWVEGHCVFEVGQVANLRPIANRPAWVTLNKLNTMDQDAFVEALGGIFEDAPWVAHRAWDSRPFPSREALHQAMKQQVASATRAEQLALLRAHPDLGARASMSTASTSEQQGAGLDQLTPEEYADLTACNQAYRAKFGFPFLFAVKGSNKTKIMEALSRRTNADQEQELAEALEQVYRIAEFRLETVVE